MFQIVRHDRTMEQIVFPVPQICEFLTRESKMKTYYSAERDDQGSKVFDFFERTEDLFNEMKWQKKLRGISIQLESNSTKLLRELRSTSIVLGVATHVDVELDIF